MRQLKLNRQKARTPGKKLYWCGCDLGRIGHSGRCRACGATRKGTKDKKAGPTSD